jgi:hypothetical protein
VTKCTRALAEFPPVKKRRVQVDFSGAAVSSDAGALLLAAADRRLGLTRAVAAALDDERRRKSCKHSLASLVRQRVFGLALGYEDLNDHTALRHDPLLQTVVGEDKDLASAPTLCRLENRASRADCWALSQVLVDAFVASFEKPPTSLVLDFDSTEDRVHGEQIGSSYHGFYGADCFMPLYVFCGEKLLVSYLRPGTARGHTHALAVLSLLVRRLRAAWPSVRLIYRGDSDFMTSLLLRWCDKNRVDYIVAMKAHGKELKAMALPAMVRAQRAFSRAGEKRFVYTSVKYQSKSYGTSHLWPRPRRILIKAECNDEGPKARFVVTSLKGRARTLYEDGYNPRGDMENRLKEQKLALSSDRTSCQLFYANQFRVLLTSLAYVLLETVRRVGLAGTDLARAQCGTLRLKLFKIGAVVLRNTRRIRVLISSAYPSQSVFWTVKTRLEAS